MATLYNTSHAVDTKLRSEVKAVSEMSTQANMDEHIQLSPTSSTSTLVDNNDYPSNILYQTSSQDASCELSSNSSDFSDNDDDSSLSVYSTEDGDDAYFGLLPSQRDAVLQEVYAARYQKDELPMFSRYEEMLARERLWVKMQGDAMARRDSDYEVLAKWKARLARFEEEQSVQEGHEEGSPLVLDEDVAAIGFQSAVSDLKGYYHLSKHAADMYAASVGVRDGRGVEGHVLGHGSKRHMLDLGHFYGGLDISDDADDERSIIGSV